MSINIKAKNDCSFLFSSLGSSGSGVSNLNFLSDYASIKNGSYRKLMKAYYAKDNPSKEVSSLAKKNTSTSSDSTKTLADIQSTTDSLKESADALLVKGNKSLFNEKDITVKNQDGTTTTTTGYDTNAIYKAVSNFVDDYNSVIKASKESSSASIVNRTSSLVNATFTNKNMLSRIGITIKDDNTLSLDEDTFKSADMNTVKNLFNGNSSYGYRVSAQASMINYSADAEASKANTYNWKGSYANNYSSGNIFNSFF